MEDVLECSPVKLRDRERRRDDAGVRDLGRYMGIRTEEPSVQISRILSLGIRTLPNDIQSDSRSLDEQLLKKKMPASLRARSRLVYYFENSHQKPLIREPCYGSFVDRG